MHVQLVVMPEEIILDKFPQSSSTKEGDKPLLKTSVRVGRRFSR